MSDLRPNGIRAVTSDGAGRLVVSDLAPPDPGPSEALIRVAAVSLNRGEVKTALAAAAGWRPGWDYAGTVVQQARDGGGPPAGARVVGFAPAGGWSELVAASPPFLAALPDQVSFETAATLPVAAGTASVALTKGAAKPGRRVLITGASGGVGVYAIQLAATAGDEVTAWVRNPANAALARELGAAHVTVGAALASDIGPFDLILDSVGGQTLSDGIGALAYRGTLVSVGVAGRAGSEVEARSLWMRNTTLRGVFLGGALLSEYARVHAMIAELFEQVADGRLRVEIDRMFALADASAAHAYIESRQAFGRVLLVPST